MTKTVITAVWACAVMALAYFGAANFGFVGLADRSNKRSPDAPKLENIKTRQISVPIFNLGKIEGYIVVRLSAVVTDVVANSNSIKVEDVVTNEAFEAFQQFGANVFADHKAPDFEQVTTRIQKSANAKLPLNPIKMVSIHEIAFIDKKDARR